MSLVGAIATCSILLLLLRAPFAEGQSSGSFMIGQILSDNGCGAFGGLVAATAAAGEAFLAQMAGDAGLTIFCPDDEAVAAFGQRRFSNLSADDQVALLLYHGVATLYSEEALGAMFDTEVATLANGPGDYHIYIFGGTVTVIVSSSVKSAVVTKKVFDIDGLGLDVYLIDSVLVPEERTAFWDWKLVLLLVLCIVMGLVLL
jgi:uncharacterized surface protein with fasciclin (FAS1) repeats